MSFRTILKFSLGLFLLALALTVTSTPAMAQGCDPDPTVTCEQGGHERVIVIVCEDCPPVITCNGSGCTASYVAAKGDATDPKQVRIPLLAFLRLTGRI